MSRIFQDSDSLAMLLVRFPLGVDMFVHGYQKITNLDGTMRYFDGLCINHTFAWLAIVADFFGGIGLTIGLLSRLAAFGVNHNDDSGCV